MVEANGGYRVRFFRPLYHGPGFQELAGEGLFNQYMQSLVKSEFDGIVAQLWRSNEPNSSLQAAYLSLIRRIPLPELSKSADTDQSKAS